MHPNLRPLECLGLDTREGIKPGIYRQIAGFERVLGSGWTTIQQTKRDVTVENQRSGKLWISCSLMIFWSLVVNWKHGSSCTVIHCILKDPKTGLSLVAFTGSKSDSDHPKKKKTWLTPGSMAHCNPYNSWLLLFSLHILNQHWCPGHCSHLSPSGFRNWLMRQILQATMELELPFADRPQWRLTKPIDFQNGGIHAEEMEKKKNYI